MIFFHISQASSPDFSIFSHMIFLFKPPSMVGFVSGKPWGGAISIALRQAPSAAEERGGIPRWHHHRGHRHAGEPGLSAQRHQCRDGRQGRDKDGEDVDFNRYL